MGDYKPANIDAFARAIYQKECDYVGSNHKAYCVEQLKTALQSFEDEIARQDAVIERLGDSGYFDPDYAKNYPLCNPIGDEWLEIESKDLEARIQYAIDNRSKSE